MFNFIPLEYYSYLYYYFLLIIVVFTFFRSATTSLQNSKLISSNNAVATFILLFTILYMGLRPVSFFFGDMTTYAESFERFQAGETVNSTVDVFFSSFMKLCSSIMTAEYFFLLCSLLYIMPLWIACKKWFKNYHYYAFLAIIISFSFWTYGVNGIRNGIATSFFVLAISRKSLIYKFLLIALAISFHKSILIPTAALLMTYFYKDPKKYFYGWLICIPVSLVSGGFWESLFAGFVEDDRASYLTGGNVNGDNFSSTGFRWDFLLYSASAVYCAYYFIFSKNFKDDNYDRLVCIYLAANAFWILVIRANFSNRFAYLSWFLMGLILVYPFVTKIQMNKQHKVLGIVLVAYFAFTFLMNVIIF